VRLEVFKKKKNVPRPKNSPLVFVHIPKTAGTSFRQSLEEMFGYESICMDYGTDYEGTSPCVLDWYQSRDFYALYEAFSREGFSFLSGHFSASKYVNLFPAQSMVTFLRDPVKRVLSEFSHFKRVNGYKGSLEDFYLNNRNKNRQTKMLDNIPRQVLGLVGITERYEESLALLAHRFGLDLPHIRKNTDPNKVADRLGITEEQKRQIELHNLEDIALYKGAVQELEVQIDLMRENQPYTFAHFQRVHENKRLNGWAFQRGQEAPVELKFSFGGKDEHNVLAKGYRSDMHRFGCPRKGHVGFSIELPQMGEQEEIQCSVVETGQLISC